MSDMPNDVSPLVQAAITLRPRIAALADEIERSRALPAELVRTLTDAGLFRLWTPRSLGGEEADPLTAMCVVEELAASDASVGWCAMIAAQAALGAITLPPEGASALAGSTTIASGSAQLKGDASAVPDGFRVNGRWPFASGCQHATWVFGRCRVLDDGALRLKPDGTPLTLCMMFSPSQITILDTWHTTGLRGTGSYDFTVRNVFVPVTHVFELFAPPPADVGPLYRLPVLNWTIQASHALGVARHALAAFVELAGAKTPTGTAALLSERPTVQHHVGEAAALLAAARRYLYGATDEVWAILCVGRHPTKQERAELRLAQAHAASSALRVVELLYRAADSSAIYASSPLERCWRDITTAVTHASMGWRVYEGVGRVMLGLEAPAIVFD